MKLAIALFAYISATTLANLSIAHFGVWVSPINSFLFIGMDLTLRDWLHVRLPAWQIGVMIIVAGLFTYLMNPSSQMIAIASAIAFTVAAIFDWLVFSYTKGTWLFRANTSNSVGAAVDSLVFPTIAFGVLMPEIIALQFIAKVTGGSLWAFLLNYTTNTKQRGYHG